MCQSGITTKRELSVKAGQLQTTRPHYVFRDLSGNPIGKAEAKAIITATWGDVDYSKKGLATA